MSSTSNTKSKEKEGRCKQMEMFLKLIKRLHDDGQHPLLLITGTWNDDDDSDLVGAHVELFAPKFTNIRKQEFTERLCELVNEAIDQLGVIDAPEEPEGKVN